MKISKLIFVVIGCVCLGLGTVGIVLPILPTVPFYMATAFCFAKSSQRLHRWFTESGLYKKHLQSFVEKRGMLLKTKLTIIATVTLLMSIGFIMMSKVPIGRIILLCVWIFHIIYFCFFVKTLRQDEK